MRGYVLIFTSGVLFFIIAVITVLHLMSAKTLNQQYDLNDSYQQVLDFQGIKQIVALMIDQNVESFQLPPELAEKYTLTSQIKTDGSYDFFVLNTLTNSVATFNLNRIATQASNSSFDQTNLFVSNDVVSGVHILSPSITHLVSLRTVWYPFTSTDYVQYYSIIDADGEEVSVTANAQMGSEFVLPSPISNTEKRINVQFSALPNSGSVSIYLKYSDGSIQNAHIEY